MFRHVLFHEAGHVLTLKAVLGLAPPPRPIDLGEPEPPCWNALAQELLAGPQAQDPTRVTAFLLGGVEGLAQAVRQGATQASRFHGLNGPDGSGCDAEMIDLAVVTHGADRWRACDLAREVVRGDWPLLAETAAELERTRRIDPDALAPLLARVRPV